MTDRKGVFKQFFSGKPAGKLKENMVQALASDDAVRTLCKMRRYAFSTCDIVSVSVLTNWCVFPAPASSTDAIVFMISSQLVLR